LLIICGPVAPWANAAGLAAGTSPPAASAAAHLIMDLVNLIMEK